MVSPRGSIPFQFTHPGKGATLRSSSSPTGRTSFNSRTLGRVRLSWSITKHNGASVSIHAPWEGCDRYTTIFIVARIMFQFTHPGKGATNRTLPKEEVLRVSIHAPWEGCDLTLTIITMAQNVSIHAPWEGCDKSTTISTVVRIMFQFTHPGKGATPHRGGQKKLSRFQFTHPGKGATRLTPTRYMLRLSFNSRTLGRVRLLRDRILPSPKSFNSRTLGRVRRF